MLFTGVRNPGFNWKARKSARAEEAEYCGLLSSTDVAKRLKARGHKGVTTDDVQKVGEEYSVEWHHVYRRGWMQEMYYFEPSVLNNEEFIREVLAARDERVTRRKLIAWVEEDTIMTENGPETVYIVFELVKLDPRFEYGRTEEVVPCWGRHKTREEAEARAEEIRARRKNGR